MSSVMGTQTTQFATDSDCTRCWACLTHDDDQFKYTGDLYILAHFYILCTAWTAPIICLSGDPPKTFKQPSKIGKHFDTTEFTELYDLLHSTSKKIPNALGKRPKCHISISHHMKQAFASNSGLGWKSTLVFSFDVREWKGFLFCF